MALPEPEPRKSEEEILAAAEENMKFLGGDPSADEPLPVGESIPADLLEDVDEDEEVDDDLDSDDDSSDDSTPEDKDGEEEADTDDDDDDKDEDAHKATDSEDEEPQLTNAYYRAAIHSGYDEKEIVEFMAVNPTLAIKTFAKMHDQMNSVSQEFAKIGRYKKEQANKPDPKPDDKPSFKKVDLDKLREDDPDNPLVDVLEEIQNQNKSVFDELAKRPTQAVDTSQFASDQQKLEADKVTLVGETIDSFFRGPDMEQYAAVYGVLPDKVKSWDELLPSEKMNRLAVVDQVEELISGAKALGKDIDVVDALGRAHLLTTSSVKETMIRKDIMAKVKKRSKSITLKPNGTSRPAGSTSKKGKAKTEQDVIDNAETRMKKVFSR